MMATDENALICDLAETYHIFDYKSLPLSKVAIFSVGLREDSRIKMRMNEVIHPLNSILLAAIADRLSFIAWTKTVDSQKGINRPSSILNHLLGIEKEKEVEGFATVDEFENRWEEIVKRGED